MAQKLEADTVGAEGKKKKDRMRLLMTFVGRTVAPRDLAPPKSELYHRHAKTQVCIYRCTPNGEV